MSKVATPVQPPNQTEIPTELTPQQKGAITRAKNKALKAAAKAGKAKSNGNVPTTSEKVSEYVKTKAGKFMFWRQQMRIKGKTVSGIVKKADMATFENLCDGVPNFDIDNWVVREDWRKRVYKNYEAIFKKELLEIELKEA